jgi:organic radical activating enzyme
VDALAASLHAAGYDIEIETNGRHRPLDRPDIRYNVSPKLSNAGDAEADRIRLDVLRTLAEADSVFKFVCRDHRDLEEVEAIVAAVGVDGSDVWISPLGTTASEVVAATASLADSVLARGWNLSSRLHVLAWGDERGR